MTDSQQTRYAQFNVVTVTARVYNVDLVNGKDGEFLSVSLISTATKDGEDIVYTFTDGERILGLYRKGFFTKGREVTVTGHLSGIKVAYRAKDGTVKLLKQPQLKLTGTTILDGGLGRQPKAQQKSEDFGGMTISQADGTPELDETPSLEKEPAAMPF